MVIDKDKYVELLLAVTQSFDSNYVSIEAIGKIIDVLCSSKEFEDVARRLDLTGMSLETIQECEYVTGDIDELGFITFEIPEEKMQEILDRDPEATVAFNNASIKYGYAKYTEYNSDDAAHFDFDDPDGEYTLQYVTDASNECETMLFTDGDLKENKIEPDFDSDYTYNRDISVENATFSIALGTKRGKPTGITIRGLSIGNYLFMVQEALKLLKGLNTGYTVIEKEKPRVFKLMRN